MSASYMKCLSCPPALILTWILSNLQHSIQVALLTPKLVLSRRGWWITNSSSTWPLELILTPLIRIIKTAGRLQTLVFGEWELIMFLFPLCAPIWSKDLLLKSKILSLYSNETQLHSSVKCNIVLRHIKDWTYQL